MTEREGPLLLGFRRLRRRRSLVLLALAVSLVASLCVDVSVGPSGLGVLDVLHGILVPDALPPRHRIILWEVRLPDALIALAVGAALGLAGVESQTILDNPLASPFTLGVSSAAVLGASVAIVLGPTLPLLSSVALVPVSALAFSLLAGAVILVIVRRTAGARETVVLFGVAMVFLCNALTAALQYVADADAIQEIVFWMIGNLTRAGWTEVAIVTGVLVVLAPFSLRDVWLLTLLRGGEAHARSVGADVAGLRVRVVVRVSALAAVAVCFVGTIGFIGLVGPHIARMLLGEDHRMLVPGSALCGATLLSLASILSKTLLPGAIVPVGILTAVVGVPVLLLLLARRRMLQ